MSMRLSEGVIKEWEAKALDLSVQISEFNRIKTASEFNRFYAVVYSWIQ